MEQTVNPGRGHLLSVEYVHSFAEFPVRGDHRAALLVAMPDTLRQEL